MKKTVTSFHFGAFIIIAMISLGCQNSPDTNQSTITPTYEANRRSKDTHSKSIIQSPPEEINNQVQYYRVNIANGSLNLRPPNGVEWNYAYTLAKGQCIASTGKRDNVGEYTMLSVLYPKPGWAAEKHLVRSETCAEIFIIIQELYDIYQTSCSQSRDNSDNIVPSYFVDWFNTYVYEKARYEAFEHNEIDVESFIFDSGIMSAKNEWDHFSNLTCDDTNLSDFSEGIWPFVNDSSTDNFHMEINLDGGDCNVFWYFNKINNKWRIVREELHCCCGFN